MMAWACAALALTPACLTLTATLTTGCGTDAAIARGVDRLSEASVRVIDEGRGVATAASSTAAAVSDAAVAVSSIFENVSLYVNGLLGLALADAHRRRRKHLKALNGKTKKPPCAPAPDQPAAG